MAEKSSLDPAGTPRTGQVFAVMDSSDVCGDAKRELTEMGLQFEEFQSEDAPALEQPKGAGMIGTLMRTLKDIGGETNMANLYAQHLRAGKVVLAVQVPDAETAQQVTNIITRCGGYEVAYFRELGIQHMSPTENIEHNIPTHSGSNTVA
jgi:hypothetical protein